MKERASAAAMTIASRFPPVPMRSGNFSGMDPITDPLTGNPFPNNVIPADRINQTATYFLPFFPEPNSGDSVYLFSALQCPRRSGQWPH